MDEEREERLKVMRGDAAFKLDLSKLVDRAAVVYGIRHNLELAKSDVITQLCSGDSAAQNVDLCRARNARLIMSGIIPSAEDMGGFDQQDSASGITLKRPYCIWHPEFAPESLYRTLVAEYPDLRYQVGRACAAAGYNSLYKDLKLVPDVSIAEEARESNTEGGLDIYHNIMSAPARYIVMDDYALHVALQASPAISTPAQLNGDTVVRRRIDYRPYDQASLGWYERNCGRGPNPSITEDSCISPNESNHGSMVPKLSDAEIQLLYSPLPYNLPTINKSLLTLMAAHNGDIDRYTRLASRKLVAQGIEIDAIVRGIHWNPMFARFWAQQLQEETDLAKRLIPMNKRPIQQAISACRIMCNDSQEFENGWDSSRPYPFLIWWPHKPQSSTLHLLCDQVPDMKETCIIAAIMTNQETLFDQFKAEPPTQGMFFAASMVGNSYYLDDIKRRMEEFGLDFHIHDNAKNEDYAWIRQPPEGSRYAYLFAQPNLEDTVPYTEAYNYDARAEANVDTVYMRIFSSRQRLQDLEDERLRKGAV